MNWKDYIEINDNILSGKPVLKGTRLSIAHILHLLASGWTSEQLLANYPRLTPQKLQAVFAYIEDNMQDGLLFPNENRQEA